MLTDSESLFQFKQFIVYLMDFDKTANDPKYSLNIFLVYLFYVKIPWQKIYLSCKMPNTEKDHSNNWGPIKMPKYLLANCLTMNQTGKQIDRRMERYSSLIQPRPAATWWSTPIVVGGNFTTDSQLSTSENQQNEKTFGNFNR